MDGVDTEMNFSDWLCAFARPQKARVVLINDHTIKSATSSWREGYAGLIENGSTLHHINLTREGVVEICITVID